MNTARLALLMSSTLAVLLSVNGCRPAGGDAATGAAGAPDAPHAANGPASPTSPAGANTPNAAHPAGATNAPGPPGTPASEESLKAPVVLTLTQKDAGAGVTEVTATLEVTGPLTYPVSLKVELPKDAKLTSGQADESLQLTQAGRVTRTFKVQSAQPLTMENPVRVVMHGQSASGGVHAVKQVPAKAEPGAVPRVAPPGGKPPLALPPG